MTTERMIRAVEAVAEKHKNDSVYTCQTNPRYTTLHRGGAVGSVQTLGIAN